MGRPRKQEKEEPFHFRILAYDSDIGLDNIWLRRLERSANLRRAISESLEQWVEAQAEALFTRWLVDLRRSRTAALEEAEQLVGVAAVD